VVTVIATGVSSDGHREILDIEVFTSEDEAGWTAFLRGLVERGLSGVKLVASDAHSGLKATIAAQLPGCTWQRCRTYFIRNLLNKVPKSAPCQARAGVSGDASAVDLRPADEQRGVGAVRTCW